MLMLQLLNVLNLDGYRSLWDKYHDDFREDFREERYYAYNNYRYYMNLCLQRLDFKTMIRLRKAKRDQDYIELYQIEMEIEQMED